MDCRNFLRTVSSFALLAAGATTGIFRVFAETPPSSLTEEITDKCQDTDKQPGMCAKEPMTADGIVRLSKIEVYLQYLDEYINYATEVGEISPA